MSEDDTMISVSSFLHFFPGYGVDKDLLQILEEDTFVVDLFDLFSKHPLVSALKNENTLLWITQFTRKFR
jgi:hypothetical protein